MSSVDWLIEFLLKNGPTPNREVEKAAKLAGIRNRALTYAKRTVPGLHYDREQRYQGGMVLRLHGQTPLPNTTPEDDSARAARRRPGVSKNLSKQRVRKNGGGPLFPKPKKMATSSESTSIEPERTPIEEDGLYRIRITPETKMIAVWMRSDWHINIYDLF